MSTSRAAVQLPVAVIVNAQEPLLPAGEYGTDVKRALLAALLTLDTERTCRLRTSWGSLMLPQWRIASAGSDGNIGLDTDPFLLWSSAAALCREADALWAVPPAGVPWLLGTGDRIYLGTLSRLPANLREPLHGLLSAEPWYVGLMNIDPSSALHRRVFDLIPGWRYHNGRVDDACDSCIADHGGDPCEHRFAAAEAFEGLPVTGFGLAEHPMPARDARIGWRATSAKPSASSPQTYQEAITALVHQYTNAERPLTFAVGRRHPIVDDLYGKLHDYALNLAHPKDGAAKAAFFTRQLGITQADWRLLAVQLISALQAAEPLKFRDGGYGDSQQLRFEIKALVLGLNGRTALITAAWQIQDDGPVQLVTVIPPGKKDRDPAAAAQQALELGDFAGLWTVAVTVAERAQVNCRPTPVAFTGGSAPEVYAGGLTGFAWVHLPDAGDAFTAWLIAQDHATAGDESGARIIAPTSDYESAIAWAEGFASVLRAGGRDCIVSHEID